MNDGSGSSVGTQPQSDPRWLAFLQLIRAPNVFTAVADIAMGFLVVHGSLSPWWQFAGLATASACIYAAGMILNDYYDFEVDAKLRPQRPLPSGRISREWAGKLGFLLLAGGVAIAALTGFAAQGAAGWRPPGVAFLLVLSVWLYDGAAKRTPLSPWIMGSCRFFNVLLGMSLLPTADPEHLFGYAPYLVAIAGGIGVYISGVTWFARREAEGSSRWQLSLGLIVMVTGVVLLAAAPRWASQAVEFRRDPEFVWPLILFLLTFPVWRRCLTAIFLPQPHRVQAAVKLAIFSLIILDAAVVLLTCHWPWSVGVLALLLPTMFLGRWIYST